MHAVSFTNAIYKGKFTGTEYGLCHMFQVHRRMLRCMLLSSVKCFQGNGMHTTSYSLQAPKVAVVCIPFDLRHTSVVELLTCIIFCQIEVL
jgi:hypothetical protein